MSLMGPEIMEMRRLQKALPARPSFSQLEWALSTISRVNSDLALKLGELSRQARPVGVPASVFEALQEMRKEALEEEAVQKRREAEAVSRLEQRHRLYDTWIQLAYDALSSSIAAATTQAKSNAQDCHNSGTPAPAGVTAVGPDCVKSASEIKRDLFPSEGSTSSATELSCAAAAATAAVMDENCNTPTTQCLKKPSCEDGTPGLESSPGRGEAKPCSSDRRGCNWLEHETFSLIDGKKKLADEMRACPSAAAFKSKQQRWEYVAEYLEKLGIHKTWQQCVYRWNRLWKPFKTIHSYETSEVSRQCSYWRLGPSERVERRLPRNYSVRVYEVVKQYFVIEGNGVLSTALDTGGIQTDACANQGIAGSSVSVEKHSSSDTETDTKVENVENTLKDKSVPGKKRKSDAKMDTIAKDLSAIRKDLVLERMSVTPGVRISSCMLAAWDF